MYQRVEYDDVRETRELRELCEVLALFLHTSGRHARENRSLALIESMVLAAFFREFFLEMGDELEEVEVDLTGEHFWHERPRLGPIAACRRWREMGGPHDSGKPVLARLRWRTSHRAEVARGR